MIIATGIDIVDIKEIQYEIENSKRFVQRVFTPKEIVYCENQYFRFQHFAGRIAVKEAIMKALGTGWDKGVQWKQIEVVHGDGEEVNGDQLTVNSIDGNWCSIIGKKQLIANSPKLIAASQTGKPKVRLSGQGLEMAKNMGVENIFVSLSHNMNSAVASVIFEGDGKRETGNWRTETGDGRTETKSQ